MCILLLIRSIHRQSSDFKCETDSHNTTLSMMLSSSFEVHNAFWYLRALESAYPAAFPTSDLEMDYMVMEQTMVYPRFDPFGEYT